MASKDLIGEWNCRNSQAIQVIGNFHKSFEYKSSRRLPLPVKRSDIACLAPRILVLTHPAHRSRNSQSDRTDESAGRKRLRSSVEGKAGNDL
ncbi:hypothetical protein G6L37_05115 [Agrobacterium rubi]|nr:hypothetical protein [Agrobacterium rubi]NTF24736.1 hypothetical protein [Agrobacterium rubi]